MGDNAGNADHQADTSVETPTTPATPTAPAESATPTVPAARPRPAFGEYAPEGWDWKPEPDAAADAGVAAPATQSLTGRVDGVPHNLGAGSQLPAAAPVDVKSPGSSTPTKPGEPEPYRATIAPKSPQQYNAEPGAPKSRTADRVITIILLVVGALGALVSAQSMLQLEASFAMMSDALGMTDYASPSWLNTLGTVSGLGFIALYAVTLIYSIQRMRARKITFWVPLTVGAVVLVATIVITTIAMVNMPELMTEMSDPASTQKMIDYLTTTQQ